MSSGPQGPDREGDRLRDRQKDEKTDRGIERRTVIKLQTELFLLMRAEWTSGPVDG